MELNEKLNQDYNKDKKIYQKTQRLQATVKNLEQQLKILKREWQDAKLKETRAKEDGDVATEKEAQAEAATKIKEIEEAQAKLNLIREVITKNKNKVDGYIQELKKDPEFEEHVNDILEKRYNRQLAKAIKEQNQVNTILDLCQKHPTLSNNLKGMISAQEELDKLNKEIETLDAEKDKDKLDEIKGKIDAAFGKKNKNMDLFMDFCTKNNLNIDREFLDNLVSEKGFAHDKQGNIKLEKTLKNISKGYEKRVLAYQVAISKVPGAKINEENHELLGEGPEEPETQDTQDTLATTVLKKLNADPMKHGGVRSSQPPAKKYKWWEFRKRLQDWHARRKAEKQKTEPGQEPEESGKTSSEKFRNSYKYDVVKDYVDKQEQEIYKQALKDVKEAMKDDKEEQR